jgi:hypothetical protein
LRVSVEFRSFSRVPVDRTALLPFWVGVGVPLIAACTTIVEPALPSDAEEFSPPPVYSTWWNMTQACSALTGSLGAVTWYQTNTVVYDTHSGDVIAGYWEPGSNRIVLTSSVMMDGGIVRHEMLHALIRKGGHPRGQFLSNCSGTVDCEEACIASAGPYPPPPESPIAVPGDSIEITLTVAPGTPSKQIDDGRFSVTVLARNKSAHWITVAPATGSDPLQSFSVDVHGANGYTTNDQRVTDPSQTIFAPHETKRQVFDLVVGDYPIAHELLPGNYAVRAAFAGWWSSDSSFVIGP